MNTKRQILKIRVWSFVLLYMGTVINAETSSNNLSDSFVEVAVYATRVEDATLLKALIGAGLDVNSPLSDGTRLLHNAAFSTNVGIVQILLENGADKNITNSLGMLPIECAYACGHSNICELLSYSEAKEEVIAGMPEKVLKSVLSRIIGSEDLIFVRFNGEDPSEYVMKQILEKCPKARNGSDCEVVEQRDRVEDGKFKPWYQDKKTKETGALINIGIKSAGSNQWIWVVNSLKGSLSGYNIGGKAEKKYGHWFLSVDVSGEM